MKDPREKVRRKDARLVGLWLSQMDQPEYLNLLEQAKKGKKAGLLEEPLYILPTPPVSEGYRG